MHQLPKALSERRRGSIFRAPHPISPMGRLIRTKTLVHIRDLIQDPAYAEGVDQPLIDLVDLGGGRTMLALPVLKDDAVAGAIVLYRDKVQPFSDNEIDLVKQFADQTVIAIENTRLLNELRRSLQQQTATADALKVISRSTFDLKTVLQTLVESTARLCEADQATITRQIGGKFFRAEAGWLSHHPRGSDVTRGRPNRRSGIDALRGAAIYRETGRAGDHVR